MSGVIKNRLSNRKNSGGQRTRQTNFRFFRLSAGDLIDRSIQLNTHLVLDGVRNCATNDGTVQMQIDEKTVQTTTAIVPQKAVSVYKANQKSLCIEAFLWLLCQRYRSDKLFKLVHRQLEAMGVLQSLDRQEDLMATICNAAGVFDSMISQLVKMHLSPDEGTIVAYLQNILVRHKLDKREYAVKMIPLSSRDPNNFEKIQREVEVFSSLGHTNIVRYSNAWIEYGAFPDTADGSMSSMATSNYATSKNQEVDTKQSDGGGSAKMVHNRPVLFIQMELCSMTLHDWIAQRNQMPFDVINEEESNNIFQQILTGVKYLHSKKLIHRDLTPNNIFINDNLAVKIGDFGLARARLPGSLEDFVGSANNPCAGLAHEYVDLTADVGTTTYSAPEQKEKVKGKRLRYNQKVDMYPLGLIAFELFVSFATEMERSRVLTSLKTTSGLETELKSLNVKWPVQAVIIRSLLNCNPAHRPTAAALLKQVCKSADKTLVQLEVAKKINYISFLRKMLNDKNCEIKKKKLKITKLKAAVIAAHM